MAKQRLDYASVSEPWPVSRYFKTFPVVFWCVQSECEHNVTIKIVVWEQRICVQGLELQNVGKDYWLAGAFKGSNLALFEKCLGTCALDAVDLDTLRNLQAHSLKNCFYAKACKIVKHIMKAMTPNLSCRADFPSLPSTCQDSLFNLQFAESRLHQTIICCICSVS